MSAIAPRARHRRCWALVGAFIASIPQTTQDQTQDQQSLSSTESSRYEDAKLADTEGELNCDEILYPRAGLRMIIPMEASADPEREGELRALAKIALRRALLEADGPLAALHATGVVGGLEVDWFFLDGDAGLPVEHLGVVTELWGTDGTGAEKVHAKVYAYDAAQYEVRRAAVEAMVGHPLISRTVWATAAVTGSGAGLAVEVDGSCNDFYGQVASRGDLSVGGTGNCLVDGASAVGAIDVKSSCGAPNEAVAAVPALEPLLAEDEARAAAQSAGTYTSGSLVLWSWSDVPAEGLLFAEGDVYVFASGATRDWTFASAQGDVYLLGSGNALRHHTEYASAIAYRGDIVVLGACNDVEGELLAPAGTLHVLGWANVLYGALSGARVSVPGSGNVVSDGTHAIKN